VDFVKRHDLGEVYGVPFDVVFAQFDGSSRTCLSSQNHAPELWHGRACKALRTWWSRLFPNRRGISIEPPSWSFMPGLAWGKIWIIDPEACSVERYRLQSGEFGVRSKTSLLMTRWRPRFLGAFLFRWRSLLDS